MRSTEEWGVKNGPHFGVLLRFLQAHALRKRVRQQGGGYFPGIKVVFREASCCFAMPFIIGGNLVESGYCFVDRDKPKHSFSLWEITARTGVLDDNRLPAREVT